MACRSVLGIPCKDKSRGFYERPARVDEREIKTY